MMKLHSHNICRILMLCFLVLPLTVGKADALQVTFVGRLANFNGIVPSLWPRITVDKERTEVFTLDPRRRDLRIFNETGMEIFAFGDDVELAGASDLDLGEEGNIYICYPRGEDHKLVRLDYKGEPLAFLQLKNFPADFESFSPEFIQYMDGSLYLVDSAAFDVAVTDIDGVFQRGYHLKDLLMKTNAEDEDQLGLGELDDPLLLESLSINGFYVDREGNLFFTVPTLFTAFKYTVDGKLLSFGTSGSAPGKFGVIAGITVDKRSNIYISDRLRSVVMIFDRNFEYLTEFGYRGYFTGNLIVPNDVIVDDEKGFVYVSQAANRGVNVYRVTEN